MGTHLIDHGFLKRLFQMENFNYTSKRLIQMDIQYLVFLISHNFLLNNTYFCTLFTIIE